MNDKPVESLLRRVEKRRRAKGLTQTQLAVACGISQGQYSKMTSGRVGVGPDCLEALRAWLATPGEAIASGGPVEDGSAARLAGSIKRDLVRLSRMLAAER